MKSVRQFAASLLSAACLVNSALFAAEPATAAFNPDSVVKSVEKTLAPLKEQVAKEDLAYQNIRIFVDMQGGSFPGHETVGGLPGRPFMIRTTECNNVRIEGVTLRNSASWMESYIACDNLVIRNLKVQNFWENIRFKTKSNDARPAFAGSDALNVIVDGTPLVGNPVTTPLSSTPFSLPPVRPPALSTAFTQQANS